MKINKRESNFELLRIVLILMVITLHYLNGNLGGGLSHFANNSLNFFVGHIVESFCIIAVNVFIIITGYFSYKKTNVKLSKILMLYFLMFFWGMLLSFSVILITKQSLDLSNIIKILKLSFSQWFVVIYSILYLLIPFINIIISKLNENTFKLLLGICVGFFYIWPTFFTNTPVMDAGYGITNFITLYLLGAYINIFNKNMKLLSSIRIYILSTILTIIFSFFTSRAWSYNSIFVLISSVTFFELFCLIKIKTNKVINNLASYTFAVYLIDVNDFFGVFLYRKLFYSDFFWHSKWMILNLLISILGVYIICVALEYFRRILMDRFISRRINKLDIPLPLERGNYNE